MNILCPTDFSDHAGIALEYAVNLSNALNAKLHILTVYQYKSKSTPFPSKSINRNYEKEMEQLVAGLGQMIKKDNLPVSKVIIGETIHTISKYINRNKIDLVVMGTQGANNLKKLMFGSTTKKLAMNIKTPILAIPENIRHRLTTNKMVLALDDHILEKEEIFKVPLTIAKTLSIKIDLLHVQGKDDEMIPFDPFITTYLGDVMGDVAIEKGEDITKSIKKYAENNNIGMLIMIKRAKSFMQKLLTIGNTDDELAKTNIPLLILHE